ncbi:IS605 OrfB family transposase [Caldanaerobacter subterraneus subsp. tengcongensis MB4]|nr:IS605 OrfB family transposase [Caldanaerobacter subterraneus subsp. tengcongensis MB4]
MGERKYVYAKIEAGWRKNKDREELLQKIAESNIPYSVELKLKNGNIYAYFAIEEEYPKIKITTDKGVIGIDVNAYPDNISWAEVDEKGNLISYGNIPMPELSSGSKDKREYFRWQYAHEIVKIAKEKRKAIVIEELDIKEKGKRGDFSGRKSRRIRHSFSYKSLLSKIKTLAKREGIEVIEVDPSYTSIIGMLKYAPQYMVTKDISAAYVIARRGLGKEEKIPNNYINFLNTLTVEELEELKKHVKNTVKNKYLKKRHLKEINRAIKFLQSLESESGKVLRPLDGTSFSAYDFWRVLKVAVVTPLSPEKVKRDFSTLKGLIIQGKWRDP